MKVLVARLIMFVAEANRRRLRGMAEATVCHPYGSPPYPLTEDEWRAVCQEEEAALAVSEASRRRYLS